MSESKPVMHADLVGSACPHDLANHLLSVGTVGGLGIAFWLALATQFGPVIWQIVQKIIDASKA